MLPRTILCGLMLVGLCLHAADEAKPAVIDVAANDPRIAIMGRVGLADAKARMGFPGITIRFVYRGAAPAIKLPDTPGSTWDHARYSPDVIVINVGTDYDAGMPDAAKFTEAYAAFVAQVRAAHGGAWILLSESGFQSDGSDGRPRTSRDALWRVLHAVVERRRVAGDARVRVVHTGFYPGTPGDGHLVAFQHEQIALDLLGPIREVTGW